MERLIVWLCVFHMCMIGNLMRADERHPEHYFRNRALPVRADSEPLSLPFKSRAQNKRNTFTILCNRGLPPRSRSPIHREDAYDFDPNRCHFLHFSIEH
uniref:Putative secreted protein n=1 Tax=Anopheles darlingi TaxID=43151 RepID=A0A2M4DK93_ANODA